MLKMLVYFIFVGVNFSEWPAIISKIWIDLELKCGSAFTHDQCCKAGSISKQRVKKVGATAGAEFLDEL
jgi:hypothetical protein